MEFNPQELHNVQVLNEKEEGALQKWVQKQKTNA
jgi:hypothetical protein